MLSKKSFENIFSEFKSNIKEIKYTDYLICLAVSVVLTFVLEVLSRHSLVLAFSFAVYHFGFFLSNFSIVLSSVSICLFFKKRYFVMSVVTILWLTLGVINAVVLTFRNTPLAAVDFSIIKSALDILDSYVKPVQILSYIFMALAAAVVVFFIYKYTPKVKPNYSSAGVYMVFSVLLCTVSMFCTYSIYKNPDCFANLPEAYKNYGFVYGFSCSAVNRGVDRPQDYSPEQVYAITEKLDANSPDVSNAVVKPNIVYIQLESFFDVNYMRSVTFNKNPLPVFTRLKENNSSGFLKMPGLGGGTCNAEFEVLTGMSVGMFGTCEYPYKTISLNHTVSSICHDLKKEGYWSHAVHNHTGTFYDRHINYSNLGFDTFIPVEYMHDVERNANNWAKDKIITGEVIKCLDSTEERDFVFAVSVQSHGNYPTEVIDETQTVFVESGMEDEKKKIGFEYYVNQLHEMDMFIGELTEAVDNYPEPTVVVFYGDHLPAMSISSDDLVNQNLFETEYVIYANYDIPVNDENLFAYQLNSRVTEMLGFGGNYVNRLHRFYRQDKQNPEYLKELQTLMYDELYGKSYAFGGVESYVPTAIRFGIDPVLVENVVVSEGLTTVTGSGFTEKSVVYVNDSAVNTTYIDTNTLTFDFEAEDGDIIYVAQRCSDKFVLGKTEVYTVVNSAVLEE